MSTTHHLILMGAHRYFYLDLRPSLPVLNNFEFVVVLTCYLARKFFYWDAHSLNVNLWFALWMSMFCCGKWWDFWHTELLPNSTPKLSQTCTLVTLQTQELNGTISTWYFLLFHVNWGDFIDTGNNFIYRFVEQNLTLNKDNTCFTKKWNG